MINKMWMHQKPAKNDDYQDGNVSGAWERLDNRFGVKCWAIKTIY